VYQTFRWWGVGTPLSTASCTLLSVSNVPMVGCRNENVGMQQAQPECIKRSDGGVSERAGEPSSSRRRVYQTFRWWGVGTSLFAASGESPSVSNVPMVGCRNARLSALRAFSECIKRSDGGVSELVAVRLSRWGRVYQTFRWWGVGTIE